LSEFLGISPSLVNDSRPRTITQLPGQLFFAQGAALMAGPGPAKTVTATIPATGHRTTILLESALTHERWVPPYRVFY